MALLHPTSSRWPTRLVAGALVSLLPAQALAAEEPPTIVEIPETGGPAEVPGDTPPRDRSPLPVYKPRRPVVRSEAAEPAKTAAKPTAVAKVAPKRRPEPPTPGVEQQIELTTGYAVLPASWLTALGKIFPDGESGSRNRHPDVTAVTIDASWWMPVTRRTFFAARFGAAIPLVPDANWYSSTGQPAPLYTQVNLALIDLAAEYGVHYPLHPRVALTARAGLGISIVAGSAPQIETIPSCTQAEAASCPHWRQVGKEDAPLPPVLPTVRLTAGAQVKLTDDWQLAIDGGVRTGLYGGFGILRRF